MRHLLCKLKVPIEVKKILKVQIPIILIPLLQVINQDEISVRFSISIAALLAEAAKAFGNDIFNQANSNGSTFDQTIANLLIPTNDPSNIYTALNLIQDLLFSHYNLSPEILLCFPPLLSIGDERLTRMILEDCILFANHNCGDAVKKIIIPLFFENLSNLPKGIFILFIETVSSTLLSSHEIDENSGNEIFDEFDNQLLLFLISCMSDSDPSKSLPAMDTFNELQGKIGFIPDAVILLYNNLILDDGLDLGQSEPVQNCIETLTSIAANHPEEMLSFITPQIKQDLSANFNESLNAMKRGLRGITTIFSCLPENEIEQICGSIFDLLNSPMRKEAILTLEKAGMSHPQLYPKVVASIFPFICITSQGDEEEVAKLRMQAQRSLSELLLNFQNQIFIPCQPFIGFISQMFSISLHLAASSSRIELELPMELVSCFFKGVETLVTSESDTQLNAIVREITDFAIQSFLETNDEDLLWFQVISSCVSELCSSYQRSQESPTPLSVFPLRFASEIMDKIHLKTLQIFNEIGDDDEILCREIISLYSSLILVVNCNNNELTEIRNNFIHFIQSALPKLSEILPSHSLTVSNEAWAFCSDIQRSSISQLFVDFLLKSVMNTIIVLSSNDVNDIAKADLLGNMALVLYDSLKLGFVELASLSQEDVESMIDMFSRAIENNAVFNDIDTNDLQNIALIVLRLTAMSRLPVYQTCFFNAVNIVQQIQEFNPTIFEEAQQMIATITQNNLVQNDGE